MWMLISVDNFSDYVDINGIKEAILQISETLSTLNLKIIHIF